MNDRLQVCVVEVECMRCDAVDQSRARNVNALVTAEDRRLRSGLQRQHRSVSRVRGFVLSGAYCAADPVEQRAMRLFVDCITPAARRMLRYKTRKNLSDSWRIRVSENLSITRHR